MCRGKIHQLDWKIYTWKVTTIKMRDPYPLRPVSSDEFKTWAHMIANTYGQDRRDADLEHEQSTIELERTIAALDGAEPVAGAAIYTRFMSSLGRGQRVAGLTWDGGSAVHRRRGALTLRCDK